MKTAQSIYTLQFWLLCVSNLLFSASFAMMIPELPDHLTQMGGKAYIGLVISLFTLTAGFSRPFSGKLSDTIGRVPVMIFGSLVCFVCGFLYPFLLTVNSFLILRFVHGFSTGTKPTATSAYVADIIPADRRGEAMGTLGLFTATGMSAGPSLGSWLASDFSLNTMFYISSVLAFLSIGILFQVKETLPSKQPFAWKLLRLEKGEIFEKTVSSPFWVFLLLSFSTGVVTTLIPSMGRVLGISNKGIFFTVYTLASLVARIFFSKISDKHGRVPVLMVSAGVLTLSMVLLALTHSTFWFYGSAILFGASWGMNSPTIQAWTADLSNETNRGKAMATMYIALEVGIGIGAYLSGELYNRFAYGTEYAFVLAAILTAGAYVVLIKEWKR